MQYLFKLILLTSFILSFNSCNKVSPSRKKLTKLNPVEQLDSLRLTLNNLLKTNDSLKTELQRWKREFNSLIEASSGEFTDTEAKDDNEAYGFTYRIEIYLSEIYKSLYLTKVESYGEGSQRIGSTFKINLEKELNISPEETNDLKFIKWNSPAEFKISVNKKTSIIQIINPQKVEIIDKN
ncbi:hypothetical protein AHMF7605_18730 [Adhaeribacter arboris]|uniref:Uncharacterized protein n=1 Tax=Adhaeribacter arboris TaxID=2072846 RepID=A0A2T2YIQ5_9BACT|nr:hypothetical protein [Adhaeribacter arboris]PSR55394.1 hypothetical protein AHMF7605_18730 [Adhaeribacter arboris]